ncbi:MAG: DUF541 domain-containing protein [Cyanobacteria bacterium SIG30]|nr:DUF541 domain-containing protein [Cyanobacteria bacterium SIG30]
MKKTLLALLFSIILSSSCFAAVVNDKGIIGITTNAYEEYSPNVVEISFGVETQDKNSTVASNKNKEITKKVLTEVKKYLKTEAGDNIKTIGFNVYAQYNYNNGKKTFKHYSATNSFKVKLKDITKVGDVINAAVEAGVTNVNNLSYSLENTDAHCTELIGKAGLVAKERADKVAKTLGYKVSGIKNAITGCSTEQNLTTARPYLLKNSASSDSQEISVPTEAGSVKIYANFNADFYLQ